MKSVKVTENFAKNIIPKPRESTYIYTLTPLDLNVTQLKHQLQQLRDKKKLKDLIRDQCGFLFYFDIDRNNACTCQPCRGQKDPFSNQEVSCQLSPISCTQNVQHLHFPRN